MPIILFLAAQVIVPDPEGVYIDTEGVLQARDTGEHKRLTDLRKEARKLERQDSLVYVSLPRLFAEARELIETGKPLPDRIRHLDGMTRLRYVFVFEDDLVIAGPAEPFDATVPFRPLGKLSGRPVLHLDDLVTALRTDGAFGCTIVLTQEVIDRIGAKRKEVTADLKSAKTRPAAIAAMAEAGGTQEVQFFGAIEPSSRFAFVCVEADYHLKRLALGLDRVKGLASYMSLQETPDKTHRFWFETKYDALAASADGTAYELRGPSLQIRTRRTFSKDEDSPSDVAKRFTDAASARMDKLSEEVLPFADLANCTDLALAAALIREDKLAERAGWDLSWVLKSYPVGAMEVPKSAQTLVNCAMNGSMLILTSGGVLLDVGGAVRERVEAAPGAPARRPEASTLVTPR